MVFKTKRFNCLLKLLIKICIWEVWVSACSTSDSKWQRLSVLIEQPIEIERWTWIDSFMENSCFCIRQVNNPIKNGLPSLKIDEKFAYCFLNNSTLRHWVFSGRISSREIFLNHERVARVIKKSRGMKYELNTSERKNFFATKKFPMVLEILGHL